jgi:hypothetical protein
MWNYPECTNNVGLRLDLIKPLIYNAF